MTTRTANSYATIERSLYPTAAAAYDAVVPPHERNPYFLRQQYGLHVAPEKPLCIPVEPQYRAIIDSISTGATIEDLRRRLPSPSSAVRDYVSPPIRSTRTAIRELQKALTHYNPDECVTRPRPLAVRRAIEAGHIALTNAIPRPDLLQQTTVLDLMAMRLSEYGNNTKEIGLKMGVTEATAATRVTMVLRRLGARSVETAVRAMRTQGLFAVTPGKPIIPKAAFEADGVQF